MVQARGDPPLLDRVAILIAVSVKAIKSVFQGCSEGGSSKEGKS